MTTDAKQVPPALSAEEWQAMNLRREGGDQAVQWRANLQSFAPGWISLYCEYPTHPGLRSSANIQPELWPGVIALANAALPDDSPYKITRADVEACRAAGQRTWHDPIHGEPPDVLAQLAAKLEALLPPL
jgi:hypothetical protein